MNSDLVSLIVGNENKIVKLQQMVCGEVPMTRISIWEGIEY